MNILMVLIGKVDNMQHQMGNVNMKMEIIIKQMLNIKKKVREIRRAFDELDTAKESVNMKINE